MTPRLPAVAGLALLLGAAAALVALGPLQGVPHVSDEVVYTLQSRLFAAGLRTGPPELYPSFVSYPFWVASPSSYAVFPPGWPALLALGEIAHLPWLANPLLAALLVPLGYLLAREVLQGERQALLAAGLLAVSPGVLVLAASRMAHTSVLCGLFTCAVVVVRGRDRPWAWALAGFGAGYAVIARPFDAFLVAGPLLVWGLWRAPGRLHRVLLLSLPLLAACLLALDNWGLTGSPFTFPVNPWFDEWVSDQGRPVGCNRLGFGADRGCFPTLGSYGHTPLKALHVAWDSLLRLDRLFLGFPGGLLICVAGLVGLRDRRLLGLSVIAALPVLGHMAYWSPGMAYGARFYHPAYLVLPILAARTIGWIGQAIVRRKVVLAAIARPAWLLLGIPLFFDLPVLRDLGNHFWCVDASLSRWFEEQGIREGLVLVKGKGSRPASWPALGVPSFACDPMLASGSAFLLMDPAHPKQGLVPRHMPANDEDLRHYVHLEGAEGATWLAVHDISADTWRVSRFRDAGEPQLPTQLDEPR
jgi:hypothetical protein